MTPKAPKIPTIAAAPMAAPKKATAKPAAAPAASADTKTSRNRYASPGRPKKAVQSLRVGFYLPAELLERLEAASETMTFGNKSQLLIEILEGRMRLP